MPLTHRTNADVRCEAWQTVTDVRGRGGRSDVRTRGGQSDVHMHGEQSQTFAGVVGGHRRAHS